ncbi:MAG TPA: hypothetical protein VEL70_08135 [Candidatus Acidoferrum sp.]|nr:hypothetical protein [Candidatus Acidoferrum sp.]
MQAIATYYTSTVIAVTLTLLLLVLFTGNILVSSVFGQPLIHGAKTNSITSSTFISPLRNATISIHTTTTIQANNFNVLSQEKALVRKAVLSNIDDAIFMAKGSVKNTIPVIVNAKIINQLASNRTDTTQGVNITKSLAATELANAISAISPTSNITSQNAQQPAKVVVDNQAACRGIASPISAACVFTISIHR